MKSPYHSSSHLSTLPVSIKTCVILLGNIIGIGPICKHLRIFLSLKTVIPDWAQTSPVEKRATVKEAVAGKEGLRLVPSLPIFVPFLLPRVHWGGHAFRTRVHSPPHFSLTHWFLWNLVFSKAGNGISSQEGDLSDLDTQYRGLSYR